MLRLWLCKNPRKKAAIVWLRCLTVQSIDEPLILERDLDLSGTFETSEGFFYQADGLGSLTELTDSTGFISQAYVYDSYGTCQQVRDTRVENLSSRRRLSWRVDPHLVRRSGDSSLWVDEPLGMPGAGLIENMLAPLDDSVGLAMMNHGRR